MTTIEYEIVKKNEYASRCRKFLSRFPLLYAMRNAALQMEHEFGIIIPKLAQGSPSQPPSIYVFQQMAILFTKAVNDTAEGVKHALVGYASADALEEVKKSALAFSERLFDIEIKQTSNDNANEIDDVALTTENVQPGMFSRHFLNLCLELLSTHYFSYTDKATATKTASFLHQAFPTIANAYDKGARYCANLAIQVLLKKYFPDQRLVHKSQAVKKVLFVPRGFWPLVASLTEDYGYECVIFDPKDKSTLAFDDIIKSLNEKLDVEESLGVIYLNYPNNPTGVTPPNEDLEKFLLKLAEYNQTRINKGLAPVTLLYDNPYFAWCSVQSLKENGCFSIYKIAQKLQREHPDLPILKYLIEDISLGKAFGMAALGGCAALFGDKKFSQKVGARMVRETNMPSFDRMTAIKSALDNANMADVLINAERIEQNLNNACKIIEQEIEQGLPAHFFNDTRPQHSAYISLQISPNLLGRAVEIEPGKWMEIKTIEDVCVAALEAHKDHKDLRVAVAANAEKDLKHTLRLFVDGTSEEIENGVGNICAFLRILQEAPKIEYPPPPPEKHTNRRWWQPHPKF